MAKQIPQMLLGFTGLDIILYITFIIYNGLKFETPYFANHLTSLTLQKNPYKPLFLTKLRIFFSIN